MMNHSKRNLLTGGLLIALLYSLTSGQSLYPVGKPGPIDLFAPLGSDRKTNFLWAVGGENGLTTNVEVVTKVGKKMVEIFARGGSARQAQAAGNAILNLNQEDGETIIRERLNPLQPPE